MSDIVRAITNDTGRLGPFAERYEDGSGVTALELLIRNLIESQAQRKQRPVIFPKNTPLGVLQRKYGVH